MPIKCYINILLFYHNITFSDVFSYKRHNIKLQKKYAEIEANEVRYSTYKTEDAEHLIVAFGCMSRIGEAVVDYAREQGYKLGLLRPITLWPFPVAPFKKAGEQVKEIISVELSMGQMIEDVKLATSCKVPVTLCNRAGGMIPSVEQVLTASNFS